MSGTDGFAAGSAWTTPPPIRHAYPLAQRDASLGAAIGLMMQSLPYAAARFGVLFGASVVGIIWLCVLVGGAAWLGTHVAHAFAWVWALICLAAAGFVWGTLLRYALHLIDCGHVAVLTDLITTGRVGNGGESMFAYGRRVVLARFGQVNLLFGLNAVVRGILQAFHATLDWLGELLPIPGLDGLAKLLDIVLRAATRYLDKVIFSYTLARGDGDPWLTSREGVVYYCQNARPILVTAVRVVVFEYLLTGLLWVVLLAPAGLVTLALPYAVRESGAVVTLVIAALLAASLRAAFIKPLFLIMMMVRFHTAVEGQPINAEWDARLASISERFRGLGQQAWQGRPAPAE